MNKRISTLQYITTTADLAGQACAGGVDWIQLRLKNVSYAEYRRVAVEVQQVCKIHNATLIVNDNVDLALEIKADGVHIGKTDPLTNEHIKALTEGGFIIGCTANTVEDFIHLSGKPVDYIGLGPFRFTTTKQNLSPILGVEGYQKIFKELKEKGLTTPPVIGIGGITISDVPALMATGLYGIAVSGAISNSDNVTKAAESFGMSLKKVVRKDPWGGIGDLVGGLIDLLDVFG